MRVSTKDTYETVHSRVTRHSQSLGTAQMCTQEKG